MIKTLIPGSLHLETGNDGVWLHFKTRKGKRAAVNLFVYGIGKPLDSEAIKTWAQEYLSGGQPKLTVSKNPA